MQRGSDRVNKAGNEAARVRQGTSQRGSGRVNKAGEVTGQIQ